MPENKEPTNRHSDTDVSELFRSSPSGCRKPAAPPERDEPATAEACGEREIGKLAIRDRIRELRRVPAKDLLVNPKNWRRHPKAQVAALRGLLVEIGYADALLARELSDGSLMLLDGHLRRDTTPDQIVPVLILDVTEAEADKILLTLDPLAAMAEADSERIKALLAIVRTESPAVEELLKRTAGDRLWEILHPDEVKEAYVSPDSADELREKWGTELGQLWEAGAHRVIGGDSRDPAIVARLFAATNLDFR